VSICEICVPNSLAQRASVSGPYYTTEKRSLTRLHSSSLRTFLLAAAMAALALLLLLGATALAQTPATPVTPPVPLTGKDIYAQNCAACHGETGKGDGPSALGLGNAPTVFADPNVIAGKSLAEMFDITKNGNMQRMMPPWKNRLNDQQIWDAVAYVWTLHTAQPQVEIGKAVYEANCATCHGTEGKGASTVPGLADFAATSQVSQTIWAESVANGKGNMPAFGGKLADAERAAALEYVRSLSFGGPMFRGPLPKGAGVITGTVTNGTTGALLPDATVELGIFDQTSVLEQRTAQTDATGAYRFTDLPTDSGLVFIARVEHPEGAPYSSDMLSFEQGKEALDLPITVYETTTDPSGVRADRVHYIMEFNSGQAPSAALRQTQGTSSGQAPSAGSGQALVAELMVFSLDGNRAYVGDDSGVLHFTLPPNAQGLQINGSEQTGRFEITADGFVDKQPLAPGQGVRQVIYQYAIPYSGDTLDFVRTLPYPSAAVNALISDVGEQVTSQQLANQGVRQTQNGNYVNLVGENLGAGQQVTIRLSNLPSAAGEVTAAASGGGTTDRILLGVLIGLAAAGAILLITLPFWRKRAAASASAAASSAGSDSLVDALARLDMAYEAGELSETAYRDQRLRLKAQLRDALQGEAQR
jgi:mono/diheme cytochrome c family protein